MEWSCNGWRVVEKDGRRCRKIREKEKELSLT
jgi:hypothetical protein